ncbi:hypothetical protein ACFOTA_06395 [Chitinophaga sp. GCM10012297]|uniref:Uncharacterized protein n=1 Tax=Chitinophaga chungangae TaxID=2821488 RepID=A0ABS3YAY1_9BACT|nr:hypothetical protein [Chitinophaga chungangae]MBO9151829.1 hypothetical protein [Chitinophaga chungangae]
MTNVTSDELLSAELFTQYRRKLFPVWAKVFTVIFMLVAVLAFLVFLANMASGTAGETIEKLKNGWEPWLGLLAFVGTVLLLPAGWALFREKEHAVSFSLVVTGVLIPLVCLGLGQEIYSWFREETLLEEVLFLAVLLGILVIYFIKLFRNRKEWKFRVSKITGR